MSEDSRILELLESLTGQSAPFGASVPERVHEVLANTGRDGLGYSQLNELLLLFGFDRTTHAFFQSLVDGSTDYQPGSKISSVGELADGVRRFRKAALFLYGNVKFAFKKLSREAEFLKSDLRKLEPVDIETFEVRCDPILPIDPIPAEDAYLTGYIIEGKLRESLKQDPEDREAKQQEAKRLKVVEKAKLNHQAYLASDHLDVYVATSMRERHEFASINRLANDIFAHVELGPLNLRWFDPTQAYCVDRIDKGLSEALMLRRATCTVYLAQETDTLGKDSELASTLAQGKPVIAYVPTADSDYVAAHLANLKAAHPEQSLSSLMLDQLRIFEPRAAWSNDEVRRWLENPEAMDLEMLKSRLAQQMASVYDRRANALRDTHPLGIQVNLATGVANGVLVVRNVADCAALIRRIVTGRMELELEEREQYTALRETISQSIFRVMTGDAMLTNTYWNFYLDPAE